MEYNTGATGSRLRSYSRRIGRAGHAIAAWLALGAALFGTPARAAPVIGVDAAFNVSLASGTANYSVPILAPPGVAGLQPSIALSYSNQSGNGLAGVGWTVSGLSSISRCAETIATNNVAGRINYDANDRYCYNGLQLLALNGGTYGADGTRYTTEIEQFDHIVSHGNSNPGGTPEPVWWEVHTRSGQTLQFGNSSTSTVFAYPSTVFAESWWVNQISDAASNYITVQYYNYESLSQIIMNSDRAFAPSSVWMPSAGTRAHFH